MRVTWKSIPGKTEQGLMIHLGRDKHFNYYTSHSNQETPAKLVELRIRHNSNNQGISIKRITPRGKFQITHLEQEGETLTEKEKKEILEKISFISKAMEDHPYLPITDQFNEHILAMLKASLRTKRRSSSQP